MAGLVALLVAPLLFSTTDAWGPDGHTIVAHIANKLIPAGVAARLQADLGNVSLDEASDFCDDYDHTPEGRWSTELHFINMPDGICAFDWKRDCVEDRCNPGAIVNFTRQVFDKTLSAERRLFALKFMIHMMGALHQPLHVSHASDEGGNSIKIPAYHFSANASHWSHYPTNLHSVWDGTIVVEAINELYAQGQKQGLAFPIHYHKWELIAGLLEQRLGGEWSENRAGWQAIVADARNESALRAGLATIADETGARACNYAYKWANGTAVRTGDVLDRAYYLRAEPIVLEQLAKGGVRLAALLASALEAAQAAEGLGEEQRGVASEATAVLV